MIPLAMDGISILKFPVSNLQHWFANYKLNHCFTEILSIFADMVLLSKMITAQDFKEHWWLYLSMPIIASIIGYLTKIVAIRMMFEPLEFIGIKPFLGWQ